MADERAALAQRKRETIDKALEGFPARLRAQMEMWSKGRPNIRGFANALGDVPGTSRPMLHRYLDGSAHPPITFCIAAARELGCSLEWLLTGEGAPYPSKAPDDEYAEQVDHVVYMSLLDGIGNWASMLDARVFNDVVSAIHAIAIEQLRKVHETDGGELAGTWSFEEIQPHLRKAANAVCLSIGAACERLAQGLNAPGKWLEVDAGHVNRFVERVVPAFADLLDAVTWVEPPRDLLEMALEQLNSRIATEESEG
ncbi:MAG: hypothetical protein JO306_03715 [Gemmatimonadetes bacterium]|nr:hypothetical protein [Gemmatimonadota bacterium]